MGFEGLHVDAPGLSEKTTGLVETAIAVGGEIELGAVAGREDGCLAQSVVADQAGESRRLIVFGEGQPFADLDRRGMVVESQG